MSLGYGGWCEGRFLAGVLLLVGLALEPAVGLAQVTTAITSSGLGTTVTQSGTTFNINGTTTKGPNLFHSFGLFSVGAGNTANFCNAAICGATSVLFGIQNILGRVTGGQPSNIFGTIQTTNFSTANLFLINPAGVVFGPTARLNVGGSFFVSTADYVRFADLPDGTPGGSFVANTSPLPASGLTTNPVAFGFLNPNPATIFVDGSTLQLTAANKTLAVVGGEAVFADPQLSALNITIPAGLTIAGVSPTSSTTTLRAPSGQVQIVGVASAGEVVFNPKLDVGGIPSLGQVNLNQGAIIDVSGTVGSVAIRAGHLVVTDTTRIRANTTGTATTPTPPVVDIVATDSVEISNNSQISSNNTGALAGGALMITAPSVTLAGAGTLVSTANFGAGRGGDIVIQSATLRMSAGVKLTSTARVKGGDIKVTATDSAEISGAGTGIVSSGSAGFPNADVGAIDLNVGQLSLTDQAGITSGSLTGRSGTLAVSATDSIGITNGGNIQSQTFAGNVGSVTLSAPSLLIDNGFVSTATIGSGNAGPVAVNVGTLTLMNGGQITSSSGTGVLAATGKGGDIAITATDSVLISGPSPTSSGVFSTASGTGTGNAGTIHVSTPSLTVADGGKISVATSGAGAGGQILVDHANHVAITSGGRIDSGTAGAGKGGDIGLTASALTISGGGSGLFSNASASGAGGNINVNAAQIQLLNGGTISASSSGTATALAGNVSIVTTDITMQNSSVKTDSKLADGGNIVILTNGSELLMINSQITTSVQSGVGQGGNITIGSQGHPLGFIVLNDSQIRADAFGGPGGNINVFADIFLTSGSVVSASSALSAPGSINIQSQVTTLSGSLAQLPENVLHAAALLRASCAARLAAGKTSTLVLAGREGLPLEPGGVMPSPLIAERPRDARPSGSDGPNWEPLRGTWQALLLPRCSG